MAGSSRYAMPVRIRHDGRAMARPVPRCAVRADRASERIAAASASLCARVRGGGAQKLFDWIEFERRRGARDRPLAKRRSEAATRLRAMAWAWVRRFEMLTDLI